MRSNNYRFNCIKAFLLKKLLFSSEKSSWRECPGMIAVFLSTFAPFSVVEMIHAAFIGSILVDIVYL